VNCVGAWSDWSSCSAACTQTTTYSVQQQAANGNTACPVADGAVQTRACSGGSCKPQPQDCVGSWGEWSNCRSSCTQTMVYSVQQAAANGGAACPFAHGSAQWRPCSGGSCIASVAPRDCVGSWSDWSVCGGSCTQTATYSIQLTAANGGNDCPAAHSAVQSRSCSGGSCVQTTPAAVPVNCIGSWGAWGSCSSACTQSATHVITQPAANGGAACPLPNGAVTTQACSGGSCSVSAALTHCVGAWSDWSGCDSACMQTAVYKVTQPAVSGGNPCPIADGSVRAQRCSGLTCVTDALRANSMDCIGSWGEWSSCSAACMRSSVYTVERPAANGGAVCPYSDGAIRGQPCKGDSCVPAEARAVDCSGAWGEWSSCSAACMQEAAYKVVRAAANGGAACQFADGAVQTQPCTGGSCPQSNRLVPVNCIGSWGVWSSCSAACTQTQTYTVTQPAANGGAACAAADGAIQTQRCSGGSCKQTNGSIAMIIAAINVTREAPTDRSAGENYHCKAVVTLRTASGDALSGAKIHGTWAAPKTAGEPVMRVRDASAAALVQQTRKSGQAVFRSWYWKLDATGKSCKFTVTSVNFPGGLFNRSASVTSDTARW
jgi:hypothetical protein